MSMVYFRHISESPKRPTVQFLDSEYDFFDAMYGYSWFSTMLLYLLYKTLTNEGDQQGPLLLFYWKRDFEQTMRPNVLDQRCWQKFFDLLQFDVVVVGYGCGREKNVLMLLR